MKTFLLGALAASALLFACNGEDIDAGASDGGMSDAADSGASSDDGAATGDGASSTTVSIGRRCSATSECENGLECLDFAVHKTEGCTIVGKQCTKRCDSSDQKSCAEFGTTVMCFAGCNAGEGTCGRTK